MFFFKRHRNEDDDFAKLVSSLGSDLHLPQDVRLRAKANLFLMIRDVKRGSAPTRTAFKPQFVLRFAGSIAVIVLLVATSSVGVVRADDSKPGDALFPLDKFIENAELLLTRNPEDKLKLSIAIASERLGELEDLSVALVDLPDKDASSEISFSVSELVVETTSTISIEEESQNIIFPSSAISKALDEVNTALANVRNNTVKLTANAKRGEKIAIETRNAFIEQASALTYREDIIVKKLKVKAGGKKLELMIETERDAEEEDSVTTTPRARASRVKICHKLSDGVFRTIVVSSDGVSAHQSHGDTIGECKESENWQRREAVNSAEKNDEGEIIIPATQTPLNAPSQIRGEDKKEDSSRNEKRESGSKKRLKGVIESVGGDFVVIFGTIVSYTEETDVDVRRSKERLEALEVGRWAEVEGILEEDGSITAKKIKIK